ncbi:helix-turn-helix transcriptional regulator [Vibrio jasicida]|uniref:helix-turn-helix transcriptional regulator n=1 Tax=Vibrio jasicida TaxID=766224 RepID=UPI00390AACDB
MKWTKTTSDSDRITLVFELYRRIPKSQKITAKELQTQLADSGIYRDIRTIQRNLNVVVEYFDVEKDDRDKPYGYSRRSNNILFIGPSEAILLSLAESFLINLLPVSLRNKIQGAFKDARNQLLPGNSNDKERQWLNKVRFIREVQPLLPPKINQTVFESISAALFHNRWLSISYTNYKQESKQKEVMPLGLVQQGNRLYLVCRFKGYLDERTLAVHRIGKATMSTFTFNYPPDFSLANYDEDVRIGFGEGEKITLNFCIDKVAGLFLLESPLSADQIVIEHSNYLEVTATVVKSLLLDRWINGFGDQIFNINRH